MNLRLNKRSRAVVAGNVREALPSPSRVDEKGVPQLIQSIRYVRDLLQLAVTTFTGQRVLYDADYILDDIDILQRELTDDQYERALLTLEPLVLDQWKAIHGRLTQRTPKRIN